MTYNFNHFKLSLYHNLYAIILFNFLQQIQIAVFYLFYFHFFCFSFFDILSISKSLFIITYSCNSIQIFTKYQIIVHCIKSLFISTNSPTGHVKIIISLFTSSLERNNKMWTIHLNSHRQVSDQLIYNLKIQFCSYCEIFRRFLRINFPQIPAWWSTLQLYQFILLS